MLAVLGWCGLARADLTDAWNLLGGRRGVLAVVDHAEGGRLYLLDLHSGRLARFSDDIDCSYPEISADGSMVVYGSSKELVVRSVASEREVTTFTGYHGRWWTDDKGEAWIYYSSMYADTTWPNLSRDVTTWRIRLLDGHKQKVLDWKTTAGPSPDGTHLGSDYLSVLLFDVQGNETHVLNDNKRGCYASIAPDNTYRLLHLDIGHDRVLVHDRDDRLVWWAAMPAQTTYINQPHWTNYPDYAVFTSREETSDNFSVFLVKLSAVDPHTGAARPGQRAVVRLLDARTGAHNWTFPLLWIAPPAAAPPVVDPPIRAPYITDMVVAGEQGCSIAGTHPGHDGPLALLALVGLLVLRRRRG